MAEKKYSLSLEQLNELVSDAVATAIRKLENVEIIDEFDLPREKTIVKKASHWDIGQTWND